MRCGIAGSAGAGVGLVSHCGRRGEQVGEAVIGSDGWYLLVCVFQEVCDQIDKFVPQSDWQATLEEGLSTICRNDCVSAALRMAANPGFDTKELPDLGIMPPQMSAE